jgi:hypothetical protein
VSGASREPWREALSYQAGITGRGSKWYSSREWEDVLGGLLFDGDPEDIAHPSDYTDQHTHARIEHLAEHQEERDAA